MSRQPTPQHPTSPGTELPERDAEWHERLSRACMACQAVDQFERLVRYHVRELLPHASFIAAVGRLHLDHLEIWRLLGVDAPRGQVAHIPRLLDLRERSAFEHWLGHREPVVLEPPRDARRLSRRERREIETFRWGRLAIHGVIDRHASMVCCFSFAGVPAEVDEPGLLHRLGLIAPLLYSAVQGIAEKLVRPPEALTHLTTAERQLLRWLAAGRSAAEIAELKGRSVSTIRNQLTCVYAKLRVPGRAEAVRSLLRALYA